MLWLYMFWYADFGPKSPQSSELRVVATPWNVSSTSCVWSHMNDFASLVGLVSQRNGYLRNLFESSLLSGSWWSNSTYVVADGIIDSTLSRKNGTLSHATPANCKCPGMKEAHSFVSRRIVAAMNFPHGRWAKTPCLRDVVLGIRWTRLRPNSG